MGKMSDVIIRLPKLEPQRMLWVRAIQQKPNHRVSPTSVICSEHSPESSIGLNSTLRADDAVIPEFLPPDVGQQCSDEMAVDVSALCLVCTKPCREEQAELPTDPSPLHTETPQVTPASQLENVLKTLLNIELGNDGSWPTLVCGSCVSTINAWQRLCEAARASSEFFQRRRASRGLRQDHGGTKRPLEPTSEPGTNKRMCLKFHDSTSLGATQEIVTTLRCPDLNDHCLLRILGFADAKDRVRLQRVSKQWLRVGRQFRHLDTWSFTMDSSTSVLRDVAVPLYKNEATWRAELLRVCWLFNWQAFLRALVNTQGSLRSLDLTGLTEKEFDIVLPYVNEKVCPGLEHITLKAHKRSEKSAGSKDDKCQTLARLCDQSRLPRLCSLSVHDIEQLDSGALQSISRHCLPQLRRVSLHCSTEQVRRLASREMFWWSFYCALSPSLTHYALEVPGLDVFYDYHLRLLDDRLKLAKGLPGLTSLHLTKSDRYNQNKGGPNGELLESICQQLAPQLTELKMHYVGSDHTDYLLHLRLLRKLRRLQLIASEDTNLVDVGIIIRDMKLLQELYVKLDDASGRREDFIASLCDMADLQELTINWVCIMDHLAVLGASLRGLRHLALASDSSPQPLDEQGEELPPSREQLEGLVSLVGSCPVLEKLDLSGVSTLKDCQGLVLELESTLRRTRVAPPCPHAPREPQLPPGCDTCPLTLLPDVPPCPHVTETSQGLCGEPRGCDTCPGPTPLRVKLPCEDSGQRGVLNTRYGPSTLLRLQFDSDSD